MFNHFTIFSYIFTISASIEASEVLLQNLFQKRLLSTIEIDLLIYSHTVQERVSKGSY